MEFSQLSDFLSEKESRLMVMEKELTKLKEDNKLLMKHSRDKKDEKKGETKIQVCYY